MTTQETLIFMVGIYALVVITHLVLVLILTSVKMVFSI
ncbi:Uncharacterised protein [Citrobacter koseri]|uniref:Uncharacterized protein n=1 Tax=Citrobacter koseri TaxID=545 RepID=A0A2X2YGG5_CITKO|nr:Uncharacterised protein [Citrobacter koseri]